MAIPFRTVRPSHEPHVDYLQAITTQINYGLGLAATMEMIYKLAAMCRIDYGLVKEPRNDTVIGMWAYAPQGRKGIRVVIYTWYGILQLTEILDNVAEHPRVRLKLRNWEGQRPTDHLSPRVAEMIRGMYNGYDIFNSRDLETAWAMLQSPRP